MIIETKNEQSWLKGSPMDQEVGVLTLRAQTVSEAYYLARLAKYLLKVSEVSDAPKWAEMGKAIEEVLREE